MIARPRIASKLAATLTEAPQRVRIKLYSAFDSWPLARRVSSAWRDVPVFCVSMVSATRRRAIVSRQIARMEFETFEYVDAPALTGSSLAELERLGLYDDSEAVRYHGRSLGLAEISCSLAHGTAYERIAASGHRMALIIEDDALFLSRRFDSVDPTDFPTEFDVVLLNSVRRVKRPRDRVDSCIFGTESYAGSTGAYVVSAKGAAKLAGAYKPIIHAADGLLGRCMEWREDRDHPFKRKGARTTLQSYLIVPDLVLNGSTCYY